MAIRKAQTWRDGPESLVQKFTGAVAFRDMAKSIAGIDTLDAFLKSLGLGRPADGTASN